MKCESSFGKVCRLRRARKLKKTSTGCLIFFNIERMFYKPITLFKAANT